MMAPSLLPNDLAILATHDPHLAAIIRDKGAGRYALDRVADQWRARSLSDLSAALGRDLGPEVVIEAGNGRLVMRHAGNEWTPRHAPGAPSTPLPPVPPAVIVARRAACARCDHYRAGTDTCGLCGCGAVASQRAASPVGSCPAKRWPQ
jgi:hypothetical protein